MSEVPKSKSEFNVFINCPFDNRYRALLYPLFFTITYLDFIPRIASESFDPSEQRINKICSLIKESKYSIHDISRHSAEKENDSFRLNMPFEFGIDYGVRTSSELFKEKKFLVLSKSPFEHMKAISDISGVDIEYHNENPAEIICVTRDWLNQFISVVAPSSQKILEQFESFERDFRDNWESEDFSVDDLYKIRSTEIGRLIEYIRNWILQKRNPLGPGLGEIALIVGGNYFYTTPDNIDHNLTVVDGKIFRDENGKLVGEMRMRSPSVEMQRLIERLGEDRETFVSEDLELSTDPEKPTIFTACSAANYMKYVLKQDIPYKIRSEIKGYLHGHNFKGTFNAEFIAAIPEYSFDGNGDFSVSLK